MRKKPYWARCGFSLIEVDARDWSVGRPVCWTCLCRRTLVLPSRELGWFTGGFSWTEESELDGEHMRCTAGVDLSASFWIRKWLFMNWSILNNLRGRWSCLKVQICTWYLEHFYKICRFNKIVKFEQQYLYFCNKWFLISLFWFHHHCHIVVVVVIIIINILDSENMTKQPWWILEYFDSFYSSMLE